MYQRFIATGRISEPEARENATGNLFLRFGIAIQRKKDDKPIWFNCILLGSFAETMQDKLAKGQLVLVEGEFSEREHKDKKYLNLMVNFCRILRNPSSDSNSNTAAANEPSEEDFEDDIPF